MREITLAVCTDGENRIEMATIPIVVLPGLMASRLQFQEGHTWDPDKKYLSIGWNWVLRGAHSFREKLHFEQEAFVMTEGEGLSDDQTRRGWGGLSKTYYGKMLEFLEGLDFGPSETPVHAIGYDWRQCNIESAKYVEGKVRKILQHADAEKFVLITHSMGGVVGRALLQAQPDLAQRALGVIHIGQPAFGAPVMYRRMFTGAPEERDEKEIRLLLGDEAWETQTIVSGIKSPFQLLPTDRLRGPKTKDWLGYHTFEEPNERRAWKGKMADLYLARHSPPAIIARHKEQPHWIHEDYQYELGQSILGAIHFHQKLNGWSHESTWTITTNDSPTDHAVEFTLPPRKTVLRNASLVPGKSSPAVAFGVLDDGTLEYWSPGLNWQYHIQIKPRGALDLGDETVPTQSSTGLLDRPIYPLQELSEENADDHRQILISKVEHSTMCNDRQVTRALESILTHIVGEYP